LAQLNATATEITGEEGNALRAVILTHISGIDDLRMACEAGDFAQAQRLGVEFGDELRLMEDLGWTSTVSDTAVLTLTMPPKQLRRVFTRLRSALTTLHTAEEREGAEAVEEARRFRERAQRVAEACDRVLGPVDDSGSQGTKDK
jgi:hypothetical protein